MPFFSQDNMNKNIDNALLNPTGSEDYEEYKITPEANKEPEESKEQARQKRAAKHQAFVEEQKNAQYSGDNIDPLLKQSIQKVLQDEGYDTSDLYNPEIAKEKDAINRAELALQHGLDSTAWNKSMRDVLSPDVKTDTFTDLQWKEAKNNVLVPKRNFYTAIHLAPVNTNLANAAEIKALSKQEDITPYAAQMLKDDVKKRQLISRVESHPLFEEWATRNEFNTITAREDSKALLGIFAYADKIKELQEKDAAEDLEFRRMEFDRDHLLPGFVHLLGEGAGDFARSLLHFTESAVRYSGRHMEDDPENPGMREEIIRQADSLREWIDQHTPDADERVPPARSAVGRFAQDFVRMLPTVAACMAVHNYVGAVASLSAISASVAGNQYANLIQQGADPDRAFIAGILDAGVQLPLNWIRFKGLGDLLFANKTGAAAIGKSMLVGTSEAMVSSGLMPLADVATANTALVNQENVFGAWWDKMMEAMPETAEDMGRAALLGLPFGVLSGLIGGIRRKALDEREREASRQMAELANNTYNHLSETEIHHEAQTTTDPAVREVLNEQMESLMQSANADFEVLINAKDIIKFQNDGLDIITPLNLNIDTVRDAAKHGEALRMQTSYLQARLNAPQWHAVSDVMREKGHEYSTAELRQPNENLADDLAKILQDTKDDSLEYAMLTHEIIRLQDEIMKAVDTSPHLKAQIETGNADAELSVKNYSKSLLTLIMKYAKFANRMGIPMSETLRRFNYNQLVRGINGMRVTAKEAEGLIQEAQTTEGRYNLELQRKAAEPFWDIVWGKINMDEVEALDIKLRNKLVRQFGIGIFARKERQFAGRQLMDGDSETLDNPTDQDPAPRMQDLIATLIQKKYIPEGTDNKGFLEILRGYEMPLWYIRQKAAERRARRAPIQPNEMEPTGPEVEEGFDLAQGDKGRTEIFNDKYIVQIFAQADLSTLYHETAHIFMLELERLNSLGVLDEQAKTDLETLHQWTSRFDNNQELEKDYNRYDRKEKFGKKEFDKLSETELEDVRKIAKHEMLARGFEAWLREGKAPSQKLYNVFQRFKRWLTSIYRDVAKLDVELNDDVRNVFSRMIRAENHVNAKFNETSVSRITEKVMDAIDMSSHDRLQIEALAMEACDNASENLQKERAQNIERQMGNWRKEAEAEAEAEDVSQLVEYLKKHPINRKAIVDIVEEERVAAIEKKFPGIFKEKHGHIPEYARANCGLRYDTVTDMMNDLFDSPALADRINAIFHRKVEEYEAKYDAADNLYASDKLQTAEEILAENIITKIKEQVGPQTQYADELHGRTVNGETILPTREQYEMWGKAARWMASKEEIEKAALESLANQTVQSTISTERFQNAARRWGLQERNAVLKKDWQKAIECNYKSRVNLELSRIAIQRKKLLEKTKRTADSMIRTRKNRSQNAKDPRDPDARFCVGLLAQQCRLTGVRQELRNIAQDKTQENAQDFFNRMQEMKLIDAEEMQEFLPLFNNSYFDYKGARWSDVEPYLILINRISFMEKESRIVKTAEGKKNLARTVEEFVESVRKHNANAKDKSFEWLSEKNPLVKWCRDFKSAHFKIETITALLDGDKMGKAWHIIYQPLNNAMNAKTKRMIAESKALNKLWHTYSNKEWAEIMRTKFRVEGINYPITREQAISVLLNCGSESNRDRLRNTFTDSQIDEIISHCTEKDCQFAQKIWDYLETFRREAFDVEERMTGRRPPKVHRCDVKTQHGVLRGGYYPVKYDLADSTRLPEQVLVDRQGFGMPSVAHGSMKERLGKGARDKHVDLHLDTIPEHVIKTVEMIYMREPVAQVAKFMHQKKVSDVIRERAGQNILNEINSWLRFVAGEKENVTPVGKVFSWFRTNTTLYTMGFKLSTIFMQVTGFLSTASQIGWKYMLRGVRSVYGMSHVNIFHAWQVYQDVCKKSVMMQTRMEAIDRDAYELITSLAMKRGKSVIGNAYNSYKYWMQQHAFKPMGYIQMFCCDLPCWMGSYEKAKHEGKTEAEAVEYADLMVNRSQASGSPIDLARIQRSGELTKLLTMFYTYFSALFQMSARAIEMARRKYRENRKAGKGILASLSTKETLKFANLALLLYFVEPVLSGALVRGGPGPKQNTEDWIKWGLGEMFVNPFNQFVSIRDFISFAKDAVTDNPMSKYRPSASFDFVDANVNFAKEILKSLHPKEKLDLQNLCSKGLKAFGMDTGTIPAQIQILMDNIWFRMTRQTKDFWPRDLIMKRPQKFRKKKKHRKHKN